MQGRFQFLQRPLLQNIKRVSGPDHHLPSLTPNQSTHPQPPNKTLTIKQEPKSIAKIQSYNKIIANINNQHLIKILISIENQLSKSSS